MMKEKKAVAITAPRYQSVCKKQRGVILDEFIKLTAVMPHMYCGCTVRSNGLVVRSK